MASFFLLIALALAATAAAAPAAAARSPSPAPARIAWLWDGAAMPAWSAPEAAVLVNNILLSGERIYTRRRMTRARLAAGTRVTPLLHVEVSTVLPPRDIEESRQIIVDAMLAAARASTSGWVQLDMEARPSQRLFYLSLVAQLRRMLPPDIKLSVTALTWWCRAPGWLDDLAADEVVPMFFRMGKDSARLRALIVDDGGALHPRCRAGSAGFSPQEPWPASVQQRYHRSYWFDYHAWKPTPRSPHATVSP